MKKVLILGSTGSIGINSLEVIDKFPDHFKAELLTANSNIDLLEKQIDEYRPSCVAVFNEKSGAELKKRIGNKCEVIFGNNSLLEITRTRDYDILISALVGFAGLSPTIEGIKRKKKIALANKETLVVAGELITKLCRENEVEVLPVDSEHSAIFQCMVGENKKEVRNLILTASGGPFLNKSYDELKNVTVAEALNHPNWDMGNKVTIDSATMMNKGLEVIEARWLFGLGKDKIDVLIHPQSIIHSMVQFVDGSIKAQLSTPDMKLPIQYALTYPSRFESDFVSTDLPKLNKLTFFEPDAYKFKCLQLAYEVLEQGGTAPCILNAANEIAVDKFLTGKISFIQIPELINESLQTFDNHIVPDIETIFECDRQTRDFATKYFS